MPEPTLLLFDIDGTLLRTYGAGMRAMRNAGAALFGDDFNLDAVQVAGNLDPIILDQATRPSGLTIDGDTAQRFQDHYLAELQRELTAHADAARAMPGVHDALTELRDRAHRLGDVILGLLTGNYTRAVPIKLDAVDIDTAWFHVTAFGDEGPTRADLVRLALDKFRDSHPIQTSRPRAVVIGDTPRDIQCAHAHGCPCVAVATGPFTREQLTEAGADVVLDDLTDPAPVLALLDSDDPITTGMPIQ